MKLHLLLGLLQELPEFDQLVQHLATTGMHSLRLPDAARPYVVAALQSRVQLPMLVIAPGPERAREFYEQVARWSVAPGNVYRFAERDLYPYQEASSYGDGSLDRLRTLAALNHDDQRKGAATIVTSTLGLTGPTTNPAYFGQSCRTWRRGEVLDPRRLLQHCQALGYHLEDIVELPGSMGQRGGIVDIYPLSSPSPVRIEFFGREIESIRAFDPESQQSTAQLPCITITPAQERRDGVSILHHFDHGNLVVIEDPDQVQAEAQRLTAEVEQLVDDGTSAAGVDSTLPTSLPWAEIESTMRQHKLLTLETWNPGESPLGSLFIPPGEYGGKLEGFYTDAKRALDRGERIVVVSHQADRLSELLEQEGLHALPVAELEHIPPAGSLTLLRGTLNGGWILRDALRLVTDVELFGFVKRARRTGSVPLRRQWIEPQLKVGDYVTHTDHGIGRFEGLTRMQSAGVEQEYLMLSYAGGDRLYVPTEQIGRVTRYIGSDDRPPALSRLGTQEWVKTKARVRRAVTDIARELLDIHAARQLAEGFAYSPDDLWQQELEASFPYQETPDQSEAVAAMKQDMQQPRPMDRLICGDVGYGKTEVAVRAALKAVMDGKQVAVLVPTTVLAQQHYSTFTERLQAFPVRIAVLSRFCPPDREREVLEGLAHGTIDVCIGTHRLIQKDVVFRELGLLIVDEEQHFGVVQKEKLKQMRRELDVLTLSATPIPRTLHMALTGIRDMTTMDTPPEDRLSIKTHVGVYDERLVQRAVLSELDRNGQVFFIHNLVYDIASVAARLQQLLPEARVAVAHGQIPEDRLEQTMADFASGKYDILVTTTIIQLGLDMPNVNTLIVDRADRFGLAQLYQLRGRIGRGPNQAYAYFLFDPQHGLTSQARKRLKTIFEATELGAGFGIAMRDLEIRGAGNLLGTRQSGHIAAVGFELYCQMLADAVSRLKSEQEGAQRPPQTARAPTITLPLPAYLPDTYVGHLNTRLRLYRRIADAGHVDEVEQIGQELADRFGDMPAPATNLLYLGRIRVLAGQAGVRSVSMQSRQVIVRPEIIDGFAIPDHYRHAAKMGPTQIRLDTRSLGKNWKQALEEVLARKAAISADSSLALSPR